MKNFDIISEKVKNAVLSPRLMLSKFSFIDEQSRNSRECTDPTYLPFYYYLGKYHPVKNLVEIGFGLGLNAGLYLTAHKVENYLTLQQPIPSYSPRLGRSNIRKVYKGNFESYVCPIYDEQFEDALKKRKWDLGLIVDKSQGYDTQLLWLNTLWDNLTDEGIICVDYTTLHEASKRSFYDFCKIKQRKPILFPETRYGAAIITKE